MRHSFQEVVGNQSWIMVTAGNPKRHDISGVSINTSETNTRKINAANFVQTSDRSKNHYSVDTVTNVEILSEFSYTSISTGCSI